MIFSLFSAHWFLAIICFPGLSGPVRISDGQPVPVFTPDKPKKRRSSRPKNRIEVSYSILLSLLAHCVSGNLPFRWLYVAVDIYFNAVRLEVL